MPRGKRDRPVALVVSCEHASNAVPARYRPLFRGTATALASHRGWDPGALPVARAIARACGVEVIASGVTRLLIEPNRSPRHPRLFSEFTRGLSSVEKARLLEKYYLPHRLAVTGAVLGSLATHRRVVHVAVHTFTPVMDGKRRHADVGMLYDPRRAGEAMVAHLLLEHMAHLEPSLRLRRNYPYRGWSDGLTTTLRSSFPAARYVGLELEVNQALARGAATRWRRVRSSLAHAIELTLSDLGA